MEVGGVTEDGVTEERDIVEEDGVAEEYDMVEDHDVVEEDNNRNEFDVDKHNEVIHAMIMLIDLHIS